MNKAAKSKGKGSLGARSKDRPDLPGPPYTPDLDGPGAIGLGEGAFERLVSESPDGIVVHLDRRIIYGNDAAARMLGFDAGPRLAGVVLSDLLGAKALASVRRRILRMVTTGEPAEPIGLVLRVRHGVSLKVEVKSRLYPLDDGRVAIQTIVRKLSDDRLSEERHRALVDNSAEIVAVLDLDGTLTYANAGLADALGYGPDVILGRSAFDFVHPETLERVKLDFATIVDGPTGAGPTIDLDLVAADGGVRIFEGTATNLVDDPFVAGIMVSLRDVTARRSAELRLARHSEVMDMLARGESVQRILATVTDLLQSASPGAACLINAIEGNGRDFYPMATAGLDDHFQEAFFHARSGPWDELGDDDKPMIFEDLGWRLEWGTWAGPAMTSGFVACSCLPLLGSSDRELLGTLTIFTLRPLLPQDQEWEVARFAADLMAIVLERTRVNAELVRAADFDLLSGLPSRHFMLRHLTALLTDADHATDSNIEEGRLETARRPRMGRVTLFSIDLDRFKVVNDSLGHGIGDLVIKAIAQRISAVLGPDDLVARFGGDEFVICFDQVRGRKEADVLALGVASALSEPVVVEGRSVFVTASIGVAFGGPDVDGPEDLIRNADAAMYRAKSMGRGRVVVFDAGLRDRARSRLEMDHDLRVALEQGQFHLEYQPLMELGSGLVHGVEALLRWQHPQHGAISPADFIPVAEESGFIIPMGEWVLETACEALARWRQQLPRPAFLSVGINLSTVQLAAPGLTAVVSRIMSRTGVDPDDLYLEITESALLVDSPGGIEILSKLRSLGLHLALDDFGTGYSSLSFLKRFPVDMVKVDRAFVDGLGTRDEDDAIVAAIVFMARALGYQSVAEGVETQQQMERLLAMGCDLAQGFLLARPQPFEAVTDLLLGGPLPTADTT